MCIRLWEHPASAFVWKETKYESSHLIGDLMDSPLTLDVWAFTFITLIRF